MGYKVAIDGPAGAGKSTIAKLAAGKLSFIYVDTGAMYRAIGLYMHNKGINIDNSEEVSSHCNEADVSIAYINGEQHVFLNGEDVSSIIRTEQAGSYASKVSVHKAVREHLLDLQRKLADESDVIMDGRDIGTCVLPDAQVKVFLTASADVRAHRRCGELEAKGMTPDFEQIKQDIIERDYRDMHRETAPLKCADDAVVIDTSAMNIEQAAEAVISLVKK